MRTLAITGMFALAAVGAAQTIHITQNPTASVDEEYDQAYSAHHEVTIVGTVVGKIKGDPANGKTEGMSIDLRTKDGKVHQVDLGPSWYVSGQVEKINMGDRLKVIGSPIKFTMNNEHVILARQVIKGNQVLALRMDNGDPYWIAYRPGKVAIKGEDNSVSGTIVGQKEVDAENQRELAYQLQTPNGLLNIAVAPDWYLQQQGLGFKIGDNVTVYTGAQGAQFGNMIFAGGMYGGGGTVILRPGGVPAWSGWLPIGARAGF